MTQAYPLQWPKGRPRSKSRDASRFKITPRTAFVELMDELGRFGAQNAVVSTNAPLRRDGTPYADALDDKLDDPGVAVYFTRRGRLVCLACDTYILPFENMRALGKSIEALRSMERWGAGQVLDQAFEGFTALPPPGEETEAPSRAWWVVLGCDANAGEAVIREAYKARVREAGGTSLELNAARDEALAGLRASA